MVKINEKIRDWYLENKRTLPWRETKDPYRIWVSEIILQQTRVNQGLDYYNRFLKEFPNLKNLAEANIDEVLKIWQGLGYYSRARNMHATANHIYYNLKGIFPSSYSGLLKLKGVGNYTAAAVASIAFGEPYAVVDGNVHRVLSRLFGIEEAPSGYKASSRILMEAGKLLEGDPGTHNQALMELGAIICKPIQPSCSRCPVKGYCIAFKENRTDELPLRSKPLSRRKRYFHYLVIYNELGLWLAPRKEKDIWQGLYEFPLIETPRPVSAKSLIASDEWSSFFGQKNFRPNKISQADKHILSHQEIHTKFYQISEDLPQVLSLSGYKKVRRSDLERFPVSKLIEKFLDNFSD